MPKGMPVDGRSFLPQLRGERGNPKEWIYCHYDPLPGHGKEAYTLTKFARNQRFKLYSDGRLFDISKDVREQHPLGPGEGGEEAARARKTLQGAIDSVRPG